MTDKALTLLALGVVVAGAILPGVGLDLVAILALVLLVVGGVLDPGEAAAGFGSTTLLVVACMFILAEGLQHTGAVQVIDRVAREAGRKGTRHLLLVLLPLVMVLSGLMNNTGVVVLLMPTFLAASAELGFAPSRVLIPLSYASIMGGTLTLVGTTTNLLVAGFAEQQGMAPLTLLDFLPIGAVFCVIGLAYLVLLGPRLLPDRVGLSTLVPRSLRSDYLTEVLLGPDSRLVGHRLVEFPDLLERVRFLTLVRGEETFWQPVQERMLLAGDLLLVKGKAEDIVGLIQQRGHAGPPDPGGPGRISDVTLDLAEAVVAPGSRLDGATVRQAHLRERFGVVILGVLRRGAHLREHLGALTLRVGDTLLIQGTEHDLERLAGARDDLILVGGPPPQAPRPRKALLASGVTAVALGSSALGLLPLTVAVLLGSVFIVAGGCITSGQAYRSINLRIVVILGCMLGVGLAMYETGLAHDVAATVVDLGRPWGPIGLLCAIYLATAVLTEIVTNAGTASIMVPIAIEVARLADVSEKPFVMAVAYAASCSLLTPVGYQTNLLVYGPGGYRLTDYLRIGVPLWLALWIAATLLIPIVHPFGG